MPAYDVDVQVVAALPEGLYTEHLASIARAVLSHQRQPENTTVTLVITGGEAVRELNRIYRGVDALTDVLSFAAAEGPEFVTPEEMPPYLGDVIIALPVAEEQAAEEGRPIEDELTLLIVHGCLHLLGYNHADEAERTLMWAVQDEILASLRA